MSDDNLYVMFHRAAQEAPSAEAVAFEERVLRYCDLDTLVLRIAAGLADLGVRPADRVLFYAPNSPELLATYFACAYLGAIFAPVNPAFRASEMAYVCANAEARVAIVASELIDDFETFAATSHRLESVVVITGRAGTPAIPDRLTFEALVAASRAPERYAAKPDDPVLICYTSGTTAAPKPVLLSHRNETYSARTYADVWSLRCGDGAVVALPLAWAYGLSTSSMALLSAGATVLLRRRFQPVEVLEEIEAQRASIFYGTMSMYTKMLDVLGRKRYDISSLRLCMNGAEACPDGAVRAFEDSTGLRPIQAYAASEAKPLLAVRWDDSNAPFNCSGRLVPGARIRLLDENGGEVRRGEAGEAEVWCPGLMLGYWREPKMTEDKLTSDGWLRTADLLVEDEHGYFRVVGRRSEMIIRSGANIAPAEVASAVMSHPAVADVGVVGVPDPLSGEAVVALVVPVVDEVLDADDLRAHLAEVLAPYKLPTHIIITDEIPVSTNGKADRRALRERAELLLAADQARSGS